jgi:glycosyltransferase involved in cell wall biosynthesis
LVIVGEGEERKYLATLAIEMRISDDVDFVGFQNNLFSFMAQCTCKRKENKVRENILFKESFKR